MRKLIGFLLALFTLPSFAQTSAVTATISDSDGTAWASLNGYNATYTIQLVTSAGVLVPAGGAYRIDTGATVVNPAAGNMDATGTLSATVVSNSNIRPAGTQWQFKLCSAIVSPCNTVTLAINASGTYSTQLSAGAVAPRVGGGVGSYAYTDTEVTAVANNSYLNITGTPGLRCYTTSWGSCGGSGGGPPSGSAGGFLSGTYPNPGGPAASVAGQQLAWNGTAYAAQSKIALDPRDYGADFNGHTVADASTTNGSNVVTCPNSDCNFPSTIAGYIIFATAGDGSHCLDNASITFGAARQTTVATYANANSITVTGNSNTTATATACLAWFPIDSTTALTAWWLAGGCSGSYVMPAGVTLFSSPIMQNLSGCLGSVNQGYAYPGQTVKGAGTGSTFLVPAPNFTYTNLSGNQTTNCAVGNLNIEHSENFAVWGLGERATGTLTNTCLFMDGQASSAFRIDLVGWDARGGGASLYGLYMTGVTDTFNVGGVNYFGGVEVVMGNNLQQFENNYVSGNPSSVNAQCGVLTVNASSLTLLGNSLAVCTSVSANSVVNAFNNTFAAPGDTYAMYANGGAINLYANSYVNGALDFSSTGSKFTTQGSYFGGNITGAASNTFLDLGGNTFAGSYTGNSMTYNKVSLVTGP